MLDNYISDVLGRFDSFKPSSTVAYLSNTLTNLQFCMHDFVKFLIILLSFFIVMFLYSILMQRQYNTMPCINLLE